MDIVEIEEIYKECIAKLHSHHLKEALVLIKSLVSYSKNWDLKSEQEAIESSYSMLLQFMQKGATDAEREKMFLTFIRKGYELADLSYRLAVKGKKVSGYYETLRTKESNLLISEETICEKIKDNEQKQLRLHFEKDTPERATIQAKLIQEFTTLYPQLFNHLWTSEWWTIHEVEKMRALFQSEDLPLTIRSLIVSSITLSCLPFFDSRKTMFLLELSNGDKNSTYVQRAFVGAMMILQIHAKRLCVYPEIQDYMKLQSENIAFVNALCDLQIQLMMAMETKTIEKQMRDEIIPSMLKNPHFKRTKFGFTEVDEMLKNNEMNPDWEKDEALKNIEKKIALLAELQANGADVYMGTFSNLKNYPFFSQIANWLYPFDQKIPEVAMLFQSDHSFFKSFVASDTLCDSDKYSFCLMAKMIPASQQEMLKAQISQYTDAKEEDLIDKLANKNRTPDSIRRSYLQDLYRLFSLCRQMQGEQNPFKENTQLTDNALFDALLSRPEQLYKLIAFSFKQNNYSTTRTLYQKLERIAILTAEDYQKIGFCHQKSSDYMTAITYYKRADIIKPNSVWTLRHLAQCYRLVEKFESAEKIYERLDRIDADNLQTLFRHGECLVHLQRYEESFPIFFKVEYLEKNPERAQRAIAWCSFLTNKLEQAHKYYKKIREGHPTAEDFLNAGHVAWAKGDRKEAITHYQHFIKILGSDKFTSSYFLEDLKVLNKYGISLDDICMMIDILS
ncbi:MAG: hypothetical protein RR386_03275 [Bacteroidaceae bacterium]